MKLYEVPNGSDIRILDNEILVPPGAKGVSKDDIIRFLWIDGMYSRCQDNEGNAVYLAAWTEVEVVND